MAELIAAGITEVDSSDFTLTSGDQVTIFLKDAAGPTVGYDAIAMVQIKCAGGEYYNVGRIDFDVPAKVLSAPGTYRVKKLASVASFGVDKV